MSRRTEGMKECKKGRKEGRRTPLKERNGRKEGM
jgi:hypothetical protein